MLLGRYLRRLSKGSPRIPTHILAIVLAVGAVLLLAACGEEPMAADGDTAAVHYTGTLDDGTEFDSSLEREPLSFTLGEGSLIPGFENAVRGMSAGDTVTVRIEPADAYGEHRDDLVLEVPAAAAPEGFSVGNRVQLANGQPAVIIAMTDEIITLDVNHRLAGQALTFDIELISLEKAEN